MKKTILLILLTLFFQPTWAIQRYALLVGINQYKYGDDLEGPVNDVKAMQQQLLEFGFKEENIQTLLNHQASLRNIKTSLQQLLSNSREGDHIFIYYSGHGTSPYKAGMSQKLPQCTGAWVLPAFNPKQANAAQQHLMIAQRDLRPLVEQLDKGGRKIFMMFDTCYAAQTYRGGIKTEEIGQDKLFQGGLIPTDTDMIGGQQCDISPYSNVIYLSASSMVGTAKDVTQRDINSGYQTFDGKPHGAMTDRALDLFKSRYRDIDKNNNGLQYAELISGLITALENKYLSQKISYYPDQYNDPNKLHQRLVFEQTITSPNNASLLTQARGRQVKIKMSGIHADLQEQVIRLGGFNLSDQQADLHLIKQGNSYKLYDQHGAPIKSFKQTSALFAALKQQRLLKQLTNQPGTAPVNLRLEVTEQKQILKEGNIVQFFASADRPVHWLVLTIDSGGLWQLAYPAFDQHTYCRTPGTDCKLPEIQIIGPNFGSEYLLAIGFLKPYPNLSELTQTAGEFNQGAGRMISWQQPVMQDLLHYLQNHPETYQSHLLQVITEAK